MSTPKPRVLVLTLFRQWFDAIATGKKRREYRARTEYWKRRLIGREYDEVHFTNGYGKHRPWMRVRFIGITMDRWQGKDVYAIRLGAILETKNYTMP